MEICYVRVSKDCYIWNETPGSVFIVMDSGDHLCGLVVRVPEFQRSRVKNVSQFRYLGMTVTNQNLIN
jgi:hypothetical protein